MAVNDRIIIRANNSAMIFFILNPSFLTVFRIFSKLRLSAKLKSCVFARCGCRRVDVGIDPYGAPALSECYFVIVTV